MSFANLFRKEPAHTTTMANRQLCVVIDFSVMPAKPKPARVDEFIEKDVKLDWSKVRGLQLNNVTSYVYIKMDSKESAEELAEQHNLAHAMDYKGITYHIPFFIADGGTDVKLHDLPFDMSNHLIAEQMTQFGEVMSVKDDYWRNLFRKVPNGVRIVRMRISKPIPSYLSICGEMTLVTHKNQIPTCRHCNRRVHYTMKCSEYAKSLLEVNKPSPDDSTTAGGQPVAPIPSRNISPDAQQSSTRGETPPPLLTPAYIFSPTTIAAAVAAAAVGNDDADDAPPVLYPAAAAVLSDERSAKLVHKEITESSAAKGSGRNSRETSTDNVSKVTANQRTRNQNSESGFKRPGSPKSADSKRPSRSKNRN